MINKTFLSVYWRICKHFMGILGFVKRINCAESHMSQIHFVTHRQNALFGVHVCLCRLDFAATGHCIQEL